VTKETFSFNDDGYAPPKHYETYVEELMEPLTITVEEIQDDLRKFVERFPWDVIPHITDNNEINDIIHNYKGTIHASAKIEQKKAEMADRVVPPSELLEKKPKIPLE
jgi:hypothetical protein